MMIIMIGNTLHQQAVLGKIVESGHKYHLGLLDRGLVSVSIDNKKGALCPKIFEDMEGVKKVVDLVVNLPGPLKPPVKE